MSKPHSTPEDIARTAKTWREANAAGGVVITQTEAEERVRNAVRRGDRIRANDPMNRS